MKVAIENNYLKSNSLTTIIIVLLVVSILYGISDNLDQKNVLLRTAVFQNQVETVKKLIAEGADVNIITAEPIESTVLMIAASKGYIEIMKILIENGAHVNATSNEGYTALMRAARNGQTVAIKILLQNNADINAKNYGGMSALKFAANNYYQDIVKILLSHGADRKDIENIRKPPFNPIREFVQTVSGSQHNRQLEALSFYSLLILSVISLTRLIKAHGNLLWDTLIPVSAIFLYFLNKAVELPNPMMSADFILYTLLIIIGISSFSGFIKILFSK